jgi:predicted NAD/FAD-binding protein
VRIYFPDAVLAQEKAQKALSLLTDAYGAHTQEYSYSRFTFDAHAQMRLDKYKSFLPSDPDMRITSVYVLDADKWQILLYNLENEITYKTAYPFIVQFKFPISDADAVAFKLMMP